MATYNSKIDLQLIHTSLQIIPQKEMISQKGKKRRNRGERDTGIRSTGCPLATMLQLTTVTGK